MLRLLVLILSLFLWGCGSPPESGPRETLTYTFDAPTRNLIAALAKTDAGSAYQNFDRFFKGVLVPEAFLPYEPFVLGLATESKVPSVLILDSPWVQRYGMAGWLFELESTRIFAREDLLPTVADAFSTPLPHSGRQAEKELMAVPTNIKGNILFYRADLLKRYQLAPPRTWDDLKAIGQHILSRERTLKYGLLFHPTNFVNDFYPIFWGFGGRLQSHRGELILHQKDAQAAAVAALTEVCRLVGTLAPGPRDLPRFEAPGSLRQAFYQGEALFMINWNTRIHDLQELILKGAATSPGRLTDILQVGVAPIPCQAGHAQRYSNIGSFAWGVNRFAVTSPAVIRNAKRFISLVADERFQLQAAETLGQVPALKSALAKVVNREVLRVYHDAFAAPDMVLQPRPHSRRINNTLEKYLLEAVYGRRKPQEAVATAVRELTGTEDLD